MMGTHRGFAIRLGAFVIASLVAVAAFGVAPPLPSSAQTTGASTAHHAGVVVDLGNGVVHKAGITFSGAITGIQALQDGGFAPSIRSFGGIGGAVCALDVAGTHIGCPTDTSCLTCDPKSNYWVYFRAAAGARGFTFSRSGAGSTQVNDGDIEGWRWGAGSNSLPPFSAIDAFFPPATTTSRASTPPPHVSSTTPAHSTTTSGVIGSQGSGATVSTRTNTTSNTQSSVTSGTTKSSGPGTAAPTDASTDRPGSESSSPIPTDSRGSPRSLIAGHGLASGPPVVGRDNPTGGASTTPVFIAFALIILLAGAIVIARRRHAATPDT